MLSRKETAFLRVRDDFLSVRVKISEITESVF